MHDIEAALFGTSLGVRLEDGVPAVHGHMHHMRAINAVRRVGKFIVPADDQLAEQYFREIIMDYTL